MITPTRRLDDRELERFSRDHPGWHVEREPDGSLNVSPTSFRNGMRAAEALVQLHAWAAGRGHVSGADGGVTLPDNAVRAPDAAWISDERWNAIHGDATYPKVVPDVVVEIVSEFDSLTEQRRKAARYVELGACWAAVIDPTRRTIEEFGTAPDGLRLDVERICDAGAPRGTA